MLAHVHLNSKYMVEIVVVNLLIPEYPMMN